ncbi:hypothetical protein ACHAWF_017414 [Thalassiosira exigua]
MVEVTPLRAARTGTNATGARDNEHDGITRSQYPPPISNPSAKIQLLNMSRQVMFTRGWLDSDSEEPSGPKSINDNTEAEDKADASRWSKNRGLWLKPDFHGEKCIFCGEILSATAGNRRVTRRHETWPRIEGAIISGDLIFQGMDATFDTASKVMGQPSFHPSVLITDLRSDDPLHEHGVPCHLRGYIVATNHTSTAKGRCFCQMAHLRCSLTSGTLVKVCPPSTPQMWSNSTDDWPIYLNPNNDNILAALSGRVNNNQQSHLHKFITKRGSCSENISHYSTLSCYNKETVESLSLRISNMLTNKVWIGTTPHALVLRKMRRKALSEMEEELDSFWKSWSYWKNSEIDVDDDERPHEMPKPQLESAGTVPLLLKEGALLIHNSQPNSGKTTLVTTIAKDILKCHAVHVISAPALFAKYGIGADAALESLVHELVLQCAVKGAAAMSVRGDLDDEAQDHCEFARICIVIDHLDTFLPSSSQPVGDPYSPVLNSMVAYLNRLSHSIKARNEIPFPSNNILYNVDANFSTAGTLPLGICLVGVTTCLEAKEKGSTFQRALDSIGGGRFRIPLPSAATKLSAFEHAFEFCGVKLTNDAKRALQELALGANWASGGVFLAIAEMLCNEGGSEETLVSELDLMRAMWLGRNRAESYSAEFPSIKAGHGKRKAVSFSSVGGNVEAKLALEDALALDPANRKLLFKFGLQTPTGVLLYGPPGTGKTLLARAVAQSLDGKGGVGVGKAGGTFIALKASDVVRPEIGNSEKMIVASFETARLNAPCLIFIDEFQALFGDREGGGIMLGQLASTLLQCMDDITRWSGTDPSDDAMVTNPAANGRVVVLGATNTPWMIDKAFLRPGRFDRAVEVGLPSVEDREKILHIHVSQMKLAPLHDGLSPVDEICHSMSTLCVGFSGADLAALCRAAAIRCLSSGEGPLGVTSQHFIDASRHDVQCSSNDVLVKRIKDWQP